MSCKREKPELLVLDDVTKHARDMASWVDQDGMDFQLESTLGKIFPLERIDQSKANQADGVHFIVQTDGTNSVSRAQRRKIRHLETLTDQKYIKIKVTDKEHGEKEFALLTPEGAENLLLSIEDAAPDAHAATTTQTQLLTPGITHSIDIEDKTNVFVDFKLPDLFKGACEDGVFTEEVLSKIFERFAIDLRIAVNKALVQRVVPKAFETVKDDNAFNHDNILGASASGQTFKISDSCEIISTGFSLATLSEHQFREMFIDEQSLDPVLTPYAAEIELAFIAVLEPHLQAIKDGAERILRPASMS